MNSVRQEARAIGAARREWRWAMVSECARRRRATRDSLTMTTAAAPIAAAAPFAASVSFPLLCSPFHQL